MVDLAAVAAPLPAPAPSPLPGFAPMLEHSLDAVVVVEASGVIRFANRALERLSGYSVADLVGQPLALLLPEPLAAGPNGNDRRVPAEIREVMLRDRDERLVPVALKAVDLGAGEGDESAERFFGAFLSDLRVRKALEDENRTLLARLEQEALIDSLTGLPNRRAFEAEAVRAMARAARDGTKTLFAILDIDHFQGINTRFGHAAGDAVLKTLARSVQVAMRAGDFFARIGGEEFGWLLPGITIEQAVPAVERIRGAVASTETSLAGHKGITMTISAGLTLLEPTQPLTISLGRADAALHQAKTEGRNRLVVR